ncbi:helix-turn-helix domain-containing protein [Serratia plymuthica]|uniref:S24 family peptidase n=1 Tax=Serratia plymuthica TaxID=82996 RepID=UPI0019286932|nr:S24 family peptidase [Serratia plymuthica]MBL3524156.1 helix-turn-helix domain-containing protein [Serratia plymuthica]
MKTLGERFRWRREQLGLTQEDAVKEINRLLQGERKLTRVTISNIENGSQESMKDKVLLAVIQVLKCSAEWLVNNVGSIERDIISPSPLLDKKDLRLVPYITWQSIVNSQSVVVSSLGSDKYIPCPVPCSNTTFSIEINDESMLPRFEKGDTIFVDEAIRSPMNGQYIVASFNTPNNVGLKQFQLIDNIGYLKATNPDYPQEMRFVKFDNNCHVIGTVICHIKPI